jgi:hypothetical protein
MGVPAGMLPYPATLLRRPDMPLSGTVRGGFAPIGEEWAGYRPRGSTENRLGGMVFMVETGVVTLRDDPLTQDIRHGDRIELNGKTFEVVGQQFSEWVDGIVRFDVRTAITEKSYEEQLNGDKAQIIVIRRIQVGGGFLTARARAIVAGYQPNEIAGGIQVGDRRVMMSAIDLNGSELFNPPRPTVNDKIQQHSETRQLNILSVDDETHRIGGQLMLYEIRASGG